MTRKILIGVVTALVFIFVAQNTQFVEVKFLVWTLSMSRALILLGTFLIGVVVTLILKIPIKKK